MKIYFDGCSWTHGTELENKKKTRFSKLISDYYNAEEYNLGEMVEVKMVKVIYVGKIMKMVYVKQIEQ